MDPFMSRMTVPTATYQSPCTSIGDLDTQAKPLSDLEVPPPSLLSYHCSCDIGSNFEAFATVMSRLRQHLLDANVEINYTEYVDLMTLKVEQHLNKLKEDIRFLKGDNLVHDSDANDSSPMTCQHRKLVEIDEGFNGLKLLLVVVFRQIKEMLSLFSASIHDLRWEHEMQLEVTSIMIGDCIRSLKDELERKLYEQSSIVNTLKKNWKETVFQCGAIREELIDIANMLLPSDEESDIFNSRHEILGNWSNRWKYNFFGKKTGEERTLASNDKNVSSATQKSVCPGEVISEKSDFRHLTGMNREEMIKYFRFEISKLKRLHELSLQEKTEELFKFKREKASLALKHDPEFDSLRKKVPEIISRVDIIISNTRTAPTGCNTDEVLEERSRLTSRIDSLYYANQNLRGLLAEKMRDIKDLSRQISDTSRKMSLQLSLEEQLSRQLYKIKGDYEDLNIQNTIRDELYQTFTQKMFDDYGNSLKGTALNFQARVTSLEAALLEKEKQLCLANEENQRLKDKLSIQEKGHGIRDNQEDSELIKQENEEMILRDIEMESHISPRRSHANSEQNAEYEEFIKLKQSLKIATTALKEVESKELDYNVVLGKNEQEKQLDCILVSITDLSKEFMEIKHIMSVDMEGSEKRSEILSDQCNHMVQQALVLTKKGLWYKQMLDTRRSELQKAETEVDVLGNKVNTLINLVQKIYVTLENYSPVFQQYPGLLDAFLKTCKLVAGLKSKQKEDLQDTS
ncbi:WPP domain-associated protein isoform X2 [Oryza brachyantha]|nr:WPP domain-associated protein isoform X2 [Oryza brachyantha]